MTFGGPLFEHYDGPDQWIAALRRKGYTAAYCPVGPEAPDDVVRAYETAARDAGIVIAETGAWSNPLARDDAERQAALAKCRDMLALADRIGARCCVNIAGSVGPIWHGPDPADLTEETFDRIVETVRSIIDAVRPTRTFYCLETMQWLYPDSADSYRRLLEAVDRPQFGVHFDPVNLVNCPDRYFHTGRLITGFVDQLGRHIRSCHAKDVTMGNDALVHLSETRPGLGNLDYRTLLAELARLDPQVPLMMEHLATEAEYDQAAAYLRTLSPRESRG